MYVCLFSLSAMAPLLGKKRRATRWDAFGWLLVSLSLVFSHGLFALAQDVNKPTKELFPAYESGNQTKTEEDEQNPWVYLSNDEIVRATETTTTQNYHHCYCRDPD